MPAICNYCSSRLSSSGCSKCLASANQLSDKLRNLVLHSDLSKEISSCWKAWITDGQYTALGKACNTLIVHIQDVIPGVDDIFSISLLPTFNPCVGLHSKGKISVTAEYNGTYGNLIIPISLIIRKGILGEPISYPGGRFLFARGSNIIPDQFGIMVLS